MTCHCRCTLPAVGTNEPIQIPFGGLRRGSGRRTEAMWRLSASFEGRQTKRIPAIRGVVKAEGAPLVPSQRVQILRYSFVSRIQKSTSEGLFGPPAYIRIAQFCRN